MILFLYLSILSILLCSVSGTAHKLSVVQDVKFGKRDSARLEEEVQQCSAPLKQWSASEHKDVYRVGVLAIRGFDAAYREFNTTFADYLTATAGTSFDRPVRFELKPLNFTSLFTDTEEVEVDFIYVNPSAFSCIESEFGANSLVSQISLRKVGGKSFDLTQFGGVIFSRADSGVSTIEDIKDKSVACASISGLGSGQMQFRLMQQSGLSYINDPKQMVFTSNQGKVVNGVLDGTFDIGFVRTDQIERTKDANGNLVDASKLKIIEPQKNLFNDGIPFPFQSSTELYAEWNVAALTHVADDVAKEVQNAMLDLANHAEVGAVLNACYSNLNCDLGSSGFASQIACKEECHDQITLNCDQKIPLAILANKAKAEGKYTGWRTTLSYMELRNMQEETGFIQKNENTGKMQCIRSSGIYSAITCPPGHFKKSEEDVLNGCASQNITCNEGFQCVCKPCVKAFDVDVSPVDLKKGCAKMSNCGSVPQTKQIQFRARDNKKRDDSKMEVIIHEGQQSRTVPVTHISSSDSYEYEFSVTGTAIGILILEILVDDEQIPESPLRVEVTARNCALDTNDGQRIADKDGNCICITAAMEIGGSCVLFSTFLPSILVPLFITAMIALYFYVDMKRKQADSVWAVKTSELFFDEPPEIIGRGTFGLVLLGEYRGTQVAVKRVIPPRVYSKAINTNKALGKGEIATLEDTNSHFPKLERKLSDLGKGEHPFDIEIGTNKEGNLRQQKVIPPRVDSKTINTNKALGKSEIATLEDTNSNFPKLERRMSNLGRGERPFDIEIGTNKEGNLRQQKPSRRDNELFYGLKSGAFGLSSSAASGSLTSRIKTSFKDEYSRLKSDFIVEMRQLSKLRHPCITTVMGAVIATREEPMLIMEYMDHGSLYDLLHNQTLQIEGELVLPILRDIAQGVRFLHAAEPQVVHGDLKAQNILVDSKFRAKVADFGLSQKKQIGATGTPLWMAPELLRGESENSAMSDVYSFGIILFEMYSRKDPYDGEDHREVLRLVADPIFNKRPEVPESCPSLVASIMKECLDRTPGSRPTFEQLDLRLKDLSVEHVEPGKMNFSMQDKKLIQAGRNEKLLFDVFPQHIAEAIRDGRKVDPESREIVTIFFSDIVGFTNISSKLSALQVSDMLDRLYIRFDELSRIHDVFKVETIGDAYMAVTNLVKNQPDHAKRIAMFSIDALCAANDTLINTNDPSMGVVNIRVGFHSGPVVANVVGSRNPRYCLFGDTVNTASRMESNSIINRIQCSRRAYNFVHRQYPEISIRPRGKIHIKGKGEMRTYWINEERTPSCNVSVSSNESSQTGLSGTRKRDKYNIEILTRVREIAE